VALSKLNNDSFADTAVHGRRNLIINGSASVNQRGDVTGVTTSGYGGPDRFQRTAETAGTWSISQSSTAPTGFSNSIKFDCTTANASLGADAELGMGHVIEAQDLQHLNYGASGAQSLTLSFWVRSNKTGTYAIWFYEYDGARQRGVNYTISSADTWEHKTVTIEGDTSGTINDDNGQGLLVRWILAAGSNYTGGTAASAWESYTAANSFVGQSVNLADNTANEWYITGIQLEVGDKATPFEHRSFDEEMRLCLRYFERFKRSYGDMGQSSSADATLWAGCSRSGNSGNNQGVMRYTRKRNNPSLSVSSATHINSIFPISPFNTTLSGFALSGNAGIDSAFINATNNASSAPGSDCASFVYIPNDSGYLDVDAEL